MSEPEAWLRAGVVGKPHGLDGSFHVGRAAPGLPRVGGVVMVAGRQRSVTRRAGLDARPILALDGCEDRAAAEALRGQDLLVALRELPELGKDEWWAEELEGCTVRDGTVEVGVVRRMLALPSCEVLEVQRPGEAGDLLVPLVSDAVRSVDVEARAIDVDLHFLGED